MSVSLRRCGARLAALACGVALATQIIAQPAEAIAEPALWKVQGPHATVWLFGSVHALKPSLTWRSPALDAAMKDAAALYLEIPDADDPAAIQPLVMKYGVDPAHPLSSKISAKDKSSLDALLTTYGASEAQLEPLRPWMVGLTLTVLPIVKAGYDPKASVEHTLAEEARTAGKPVKGFETAEQQLRFFADLPLDQEIAFMESSMDDAAKGPGELDAMVAAWRAGDVESLGHLMDDDLKAQYPALYKLLIVDRNRRFAEQIADLARGNGVAFVAVGAGHLAGPDSVQADLTALGLTAVRQ
jgi:uncharacterized protein YbaP (TraB family)